MDNLPTLFAQPTPWGLSVGQTASVAVVAFVLLFGWVIVRIGLRLTSLLFRLGCAALIVFICGVVSFMMLYNIASR